LIPYVFPYRWSTLSYVDKIKHGFASMFSSNLDNLSIALLSIAWYPYYNFKATRIPSLMEWYLQYCSKFFSVDAHKSISIDENENLPLPPIHCSFLRFIYFQSYMPGCGFERNTVWLSFQFSYYSPSFFPRKQSRPGQTCELPSTRTTLNFELSLVYRRISEKI
jgi:hypothetical protein